MRILILVLMTAFLAAGAWWFYTVGNEFLFGIFTLIAFAPLTGAAMARITETSDSDAVGLRQ